MGHEISTYFTGEMTSTSRITDFRSPDKEFFAFSFFFPHRVGMKLIGKFILFELENPESSLISMENSGSLIVPFVKTAVILVSTNN